MSVIELRGDFFQTGNQYLLEVEEISSGVYRPRVSLADGATIIAEPSGTIDTPIVVSLNGVSSISQALPEHATKASLQAILSSSPESYAWFAVNTSSTYAVTPSNGGFVLTDRGDELIEGLDSDLQYYVHMSLYTNLEASDTGGEKDRLIILPWVVS